MRKLEYKHAYLYETFRPDMVYRTCQYLISTPVYMEEGIRLSEEWKDIHCPVYFEEFELPLERQTNVKDFGEQIEIDSSDSEVEEDCSMNSASISEQTMLLDETDFLTTCVNMLLEKVKYHALFWDLNAEVLTFTTIYCREKRNVNSKLTYTDIA